MRRGELMKIGRIALGAGMTLCAISAAQAQSTIQTADIPATTRAPVAQDAVDEEASAEEIAEDAARDLKDSRYYNRPGATRAEYNADWQMCRLIARGSRTAGGTVGYATAAGVSPLAAGLGGAIGGMLGAMIAEGQQRRENRRQCLLIKGWRLVKLPGDQAAKVQAMMPAARDAYFDERIGAETVEGKVTEITSFVQPDDPEVALHAPVAGTRAVFLGKKVDPALPVTLAEGEGAIVVAFRRPDALTAGRSAGARFLRYDLQAQDALFRPRDWKKKGDTTTYLVEANSADKRAGIEVQVLRVTAGAYVLDSLTLVRRQFPVSNCFGAPVFSVAPGQVVYFGDLLPYRVRRNAAGMWAGGIFHAENLEDARAALASAQPALAAAMVPAEIQNGATYACAGISMARYDLPGKPKIERALGTAGEDDIVDQDVPGGWGRADADSAQVRAAATFALGAIDRGGVEIVRIEKAHQQVVAGMNYAMVLVLANGEHWRVRVWSKLDGTYQLTDSEQVR